MKMKLYQIKFIGMLTTAALFCISLSSTANSAVPSEYCSSPPFMSNTVEPNVLIVLDNSGSMNDWAYSASYDPTRYVPGDPVKKGYYGYFEPGKRYKYNGTEWIQTTETVGTISNPIATGDFLNWATMRRIDVARKLLIGGKATPRSPNPGSTVALYGETAPSPTWDFAKTDNGGRMSPFPASSYSFQMRSDSLYVVPNYTVSDPAPRVPKSNANATWSPYPSTSSLYRTVDDKTINDDVDYIYITSGTANQLFGYTAFTSSEITGTIQSVNVRLRAKKTSNGTNRIKGVIKVGGIEYQHTNYSNLSTSWDTYQFTWTYNPKRYEECILGGGTASDCSTSSAWTADDLTNTSSSYYLQAFGVYNVTNASSSLYPKVTWIELTVSLAAPSGGPYKIKVNWKGEDWAYQQGIIPNLGNEARFGLAFYNRGCGSECGYSNGRYDAGHVENIINFGQPVNMITTIHNMTPDTWTPLSETLFEMVRYFRQDAPYYSGNSPADFTVGPGTANDPFYFDYPTGDYRTDQYVPCVKNFILLLTDGESTQDRNIPATTTGVPSGKSLTDYDGDGKDPGSYPSSGSDYLDDIALWARTTDARPGSCTSDKSTWTFPCLPGAQNVIIYSVFMFGRGSQLLKDAAINGGFEDINGNNLPDCSTIPKECYRETNNDGVLNASDLPLTYFEGDDGYELERSILDAITSILRRAASGTAVSVLTTSSRGIGSMLQAYFHPKRQEGNREVTWTGYVQNLWLDTMDNLREDTTNDLNLKLADDRVIKLYFDTSISETMVGTFRTDVDGNSGTSLGELNSCVPETRKKFMSINYLWEGGRKLALKNPSTRSIFTSKKAIVGSTVLTLDSSQFPKQPSFDSYMSSTLKAALNPDATYTADTIIGYIRGECRETGVTGDTACGNSALSTFRDRRMTVKDDSGNDVIKVWKLGDVISSTPKVFATTPLNTYHIEYNDGTYLNYIRSDNYRKRSATISSIGFVGANDGMLHAFRVGYLKDKNDEYGTLGSGVKALFKNFFTSDDSTADRIGEEVWAYIPYNAFPYLKYLADPTYCHIYFNDLTVNLVDVSIAKPSGCTNSDAALCERTTDSWKTILIGGMRFGAACSGGITPAGPPAGTPANVGFSSYYALDITDPENPIPMWEFTDPDLGYATTYPAILRTGEKNLNGRWYVVVGSGSKQLPKTGQDINRTTTGYVYILDLVTGSIVKKIALDHNAIVGDIIAIDFDRDYYSEAIYFGTAYKDTVWKGKLVSVAIPNQNLSDTWSPVVTYLFAGNYPFTASPEAAQDDKRKLWIYIGSGKYYSTVDQTDTAQQIFIGMKHRSDTSYPKTISDLADRTNTDVTGNVTGVTQACMFDVNTNDFAIKNLVTSINRTSPTVLPPTYGWYIRLETNPSAERVISRPLAFGGLVDFLSYKPNADPCASGGDSYLFSLNYQTGVASENISILHPDITGGDTSGNVTISKRVKLGPGAPPTGEAIIVPPLKDEDAEKNKFKKKIQVATGVVVEAVDESSYKVGNTIMHWLRK